MWREKGSAIEVGDVGGDNQVGRAFGRRFVNPDVPGAIVDVSLYPVGHSEGDTCVPRTCTPGLIELEQQIEHMIVSVSDGEQEWSDVQYDSPLSAPDGTELVLRTVEEAEEAARHRLSLWSADLIAWDGVTRF